MAATINWLSVRMSSIRRLSDEDVRAIFESLHGDHQPPPHLKFQIVPVGPTALRLSPPSYEFEDGLYVLLKPDKKRKNSRKWSPDQSMVPSHLSNLTMRDLPPKTCPWSLSGPQFPQPTAIQQRYCYPKGDREYSSKKGGALWTMYERNGKEDLQFRLLHVYFSAKRAINKGVDVPAEGIVATRKTPNSTPRRRRRGTPKRASQSPWKGQNHTAQSTPRSIHATVTESPLNTSAQIPSFRPFPMATGSDHEILVSPFAADFLGHAFHPLPSFELESLDDKAFMATESDFQMMEKNFQNDSHPASWCHGGNNNNSNTRRKVVTQALMASDSAMLNSESSWTLNYVNNEASEEEAVHQQMKHRLNALVERVRDMIALEADKDNATRIVLKWAQSLASGSIDENKGQKLASDAATDVGEKSDPNRKVIVTGVEFSPLEDAAICHLFTRLGPQWNVIAKSVPPHPALAVKSRFETLKKEFESGLGKIVSSTELVESEEALKHSVQDPNADPKILRYLSDYLLKEEDGEAVTPASSFGPFRVAKVSEACKRCGLLMPSLQTGRVVCDTTGWCRKCTKLSAIVHGDYLREIYPLKLIHKNRTEV